MMFPVNINIQIFMINKLMPNYIYNILIINKRAQASGAPTTFYLYFSAEFAGYFYTIVAFDLGLGQGFAGGG